MTDGLGEMILDQVLGPFETNSVDGGPRTKRRSACCVQIGLCPNIANESIIDVLSSVKGPRLTGR